MQSISLTTSNSCHALHNNYIIIHVQCILKYLYCIYLLYSELSDRRIGGIWRDRVPYHQKAIEPTNQIHFRRHH